MEVKWNQRWDRVGVNASPTLGRTGPDILWRRSETFTFFSFRKSFGVLKIILPFAAELEKTNNILTNDMNKTFLSWCAACMLCILGVTTPCWGATSRARRRTTVCQRRNYSPWQVTVAMNSAIHAIPSSSNQTNWFCLSRFQYQVAVLSPPSL